MCEEKSTREIAEAVELSPRSIEAIRDKLKTKTGAKSTAGLIMFAVKNKLLERQESIISASYYLTYNYFCSLIFILCAGIFFMYNNKVYPANSGVIGPDNRSFRYGDGLFETMKMIKGNIVNKEFHFERLLMGFRYWSLKSQKLKPRLPGKKN